jgi:hypothetical protein
MSSLETISPQAPFTQNPYNSPKRLLQSRKREQRAESIAGRYHFVAILRDTPPTHRGGQTTLFLLVDFVLSTNYNCLALLVAKVKEKIVSELGSTSALYRFLLSVEVLPLNGCGSSIAS